MPPPEQVAEGVWSIPIPLLQSPLGSVTLYAVEHDAGVLLVDAGYTGDACWSALLAGLAAAGRSVDEVTGVALTHSHPDHVGLAARVRQASGAWVAIHELDALSQQRQVRGTFFEQLNAELQLAGAPDEVRERMVEAARQLATHSQELVVDRFLRPGELVEEHGLELRVLHTPGHSRGHVCLHDERAAYLFGGDLLLTTGEVQLGLVVTPDDDPAGELLGSLALVEALPVSLVLPGHGDVFTDTAPLAASAIAALRDRIDVAEAHVREHPGLTAWEHCTLFDWGRPWERMRDTSRRFAVMQMTAWLRHLATLGRVRLDPGPPERTWID